MTPEQPMLGVTMEQAVRNASEAAGVFGVRIEDIDALTDGGRNDPG